MERDEKHSLLNYTELPGERALKSSSKTDIDESEISATDLWLSKFGCPRVWARRKWEEYKYGRASVIRRWKGRVEKKEEESEPAPD